MRHFTHLRAPVLTALLCPMIMLSEPAPKLAGFQAYLFNSRTGQLSEDILAPGAPELGNVPAGKFGAISTLVVVQVQLGRNSAVPEKMRVRLVAQETGSNRFASSGGAKGGRRLLLDRTSSVGPVSESGTSYVGFWLDGTGCRTVSLKATLLTPGTASPLTGVLPFACYE